jgi:hypothetical protein
LLLSTPPQTITVTRTIVIGGRNKYLVNGHAVQANTVADLFHAVQLNVNNPHFLIMQVRALLVLSSLFLWEEGSLCPPSPLPGALPAAASTRPPAARRPTPRRRRRAASPRC